MRILALCCLAACLVGGESVDLTKLPEVRPRLALTPGRVVELKGLVKSDAHARFLWERIRASADDWLEKPVLTREMEGYRLLAVSRECLQRVLVWSMAHVMTGERKYLDRTVQEIGAVCAFQDWNPSHFLDVAEMTAAVALALDWLYGSLTPEQRRVAEDAIIAKGLKASLTGKHWWIDRDNNWNQVCHGGMVLGALAVYERDPELALGILERAKRNLRHGLDVYAPAGVYPEGAGYWGYGTDFSSFTAQGLETALGTDWGITAAPGFVESFDFRRHADDPLGQPVLFADAGWGKTRAQFLTPYYHVAHAAKRPDLLAGITAYHEQHFARHQGTIGRFYPLALAAYRPVPAGTAVEQALDFFGLGGPIEFVALRSSWDDPDATWATLKGGANAWNHSHLDTGVFELAADGVRWAWDLGADKHLYTRKDTWGLQQDSARWEYLRTHNRGHNVVQVGSRRQRVAGAAKVIAHASTDDTAWAVMDTSSAYAGMAKEARRGVALVNGRRVAVIQDEFSDLVKEPLTWRMYTRAKVTIDGGKAVLEEDGKQLTLRIRLPVGAVFTEGSVEPPKDYENPNEGFRVLEAKVEPPHAQQVTICVVAVPGSRLGKVDVAAPVPIGEWAKQ